MFLVKEFLPTRLNNGLETAKTEGKIDGQKKLAFDRPAPKLPVRTTEKLTRKAAICQFRFSC